MLTVESPAVSQNCSAANDALSQTMAWARRHLTERGLIVALIAAHLAIVLPLMIWLGVGIDDSFTLETTRHGLGPAIQRGMWFELQPPFYFAVLSLWRQVFGDSMLAARLFSVVCSTLFLIVLAGVSRRFVPQIRAPWLIAVVALHPFVIWAAVEIRLYALMLLVSALQLRTFHDGFLAGSDAAPSDGIHPRCRSRVWSLVLATIGLYTHYYSGFLLVAHAGVLIVLRRWRSLRVYLVAMVIVGACFAPLVFVIPRQFSEHTRGIAETTLLDCVKVVGWQVQYELLPVSRQMTSGQQFWSKWIWRALILACPLLLLPKIRERLWQRHNVTVLILAAGLALLFVLLVQMVGSGMFEFRHGLMLFVPMLLASFAVAGAIAGNRGVGWWSCLMLCFGAAAVINDYRLFAKNGDWIRVADYLQTHERRGEPVVVFLPTSGLALSQHYTGANELVVVPRKEECLTFDVREYVLDGPAAIETPLQEIAPTADVVWLVTSGAKHYMGIDLGWPVLEDWVRERFIVLDEVRFHGSTVRRLRRKRDELANRPSDVRVFLERTDELED